MNLFTYFSMQKVNKGLLIEERSLAEQDYFYQIMRLLSVSSMPRVRIAKAWNGKEIILDAKADVYIKAVERGIVSANGRSYSPAVHIQHFSF